MYETNWGSCLRSQIGGCAHFSPLLILFPLSGLEEEVRKGEKSAGLRGGPGFFEPWDKSSKAAPRVQRNHYPFENNCSDMTPLPFHFFKERKERRLWWWLQSTHRLSFPLPSALKVEERADGGENTSGGYYHSHCWSLPLPPALSQLLVGWTVQMTAHILGRRQASCPPRRVEPCWCQPHSRHQQSSAAATWSRTGFFQSIGEAQQCCGIK